MKALQKNPGLMLDAEKKIIAIIQETKKAFYTDAKVTPGKFRNGPQIFKEGYQKADFEFPAKDKLSYDNPIVGFKHCPLIGNGGLNVIMKDGQKSGLPYNLFAEFNYKEVRIKPEGAQVKKVIMLGND